MKEQKWKTRTDLALEITENLGETEIEDGVSIQINYNENHNMKETIIRILNKNGEQTIGKPIGTYITIEGEDLSLPDESYHKEMSCFLAKRLAYILKQYKHILVAGLGNDQITSDSLGPDVIKNLFVTRHLMKEGIVKNARLVSALIPGVMGQTGIETVEIIKGTVKEIKPDVLLVIDALAARNVKRLNKTIQICNTGIAPGSGVGNHRKEISKKTVGVDVIAIGVPTVIAVPTLVNDALSLLTEDADEMSLNHYIVPELLDMFVTPKNIDEAVKKISYTISEAINEIVI
ncbi:MAG: GPR endopeptidase [Lachnospiraceae bacterium]|nr:GPR endopeptidase [Lachnospiraceae bacterium]